MEQGMAGYLFVHFTGEQKDGEQIYFSVSRDGLHWTDLNDGKPVLYSHIGECGVRDPFPVKNPLNGRYYLIATDLRIEKGEGWQAAQERGSRDIIIWESEDLVHWEKERAHTVGIREAGCVWAPEAVFDEEEQAFLVFFASKVKCKEGIIRALSCGRSEMNRIPRTSRNLHTSTGIPSMNWHMRQTRLTVRSL